MEQTQVEKSREIGAIMDAMPSEAEMIEAFGAGCVETMPDGEVRYYFIKPWMTEQEKVENWNKFNEMMAAARGMQCERSDRIDQNNQDAGVEAISPGGKIVHLSGEKMENRLAAKPGWKPLTTMKKRALRLGGGAPREAAGKWVESNGVMRKA